MIITLCVSVPMSFSFGIVMWEIATREKPFNGMYLPTTALNIATSVFFSWLLPQKQCTLLLS